MKGKERKIMFRTGCSLVTFLVLILFTATLGENLDSVEEGGSEDMSKTDDTDNLRQVHVLFRHGDRSPTHTYNTDLYTEKDWPQGYGQLSTTGMQQAYDLGVFFQQTYVDNGFLDAAYNRSQVHVRSTSYDRTLMTAYSMLAGLFPPNGDQIWKEELPWQPIPVHTVPIDEDYLLHTDYQCPAFDKHNKEFYDTSPIFNKTLMENKDLFDYMALYTKYPAKWEPMRTILDPVLCEYFSNYSIPDWADDVLDRLFDLRDIFESTIMPPAYAYLRGGVLLGEMLDHMQNISSKGNNTITEKIFMYSGHDSTIVALLLTMGVFNYKQPPYTACVIVKLYGQPDGEFTVLISYRNETDSEPYTLKLPNCDKYCPLQQFSQIMKSSVVKDIDAACGLPNTDSMVLKHPSGATIAVAILTGALLLSTLIGGILCCVKRNKLQDMHDYKLVPMESD